MSLVYMFTGEGKGKTSAALGMALRAVCNDMRVAWVAWYKESSWQVSEYKMKELLGIDLYVGGKGFYFFDQSKVKATKVGVVVDKVSATAHQTAAQQTLAHAKTLLRTQQYDLLILDEVCQAVSEELVSQKAIVELIGMRGKTHLVLTGRHCPPKLITIADTVTEMKKVKHVYDQGVAAVKGLDF